MDGHQSTAGDNIRYASEEDRRKAELLAASIDAAMEDLDRNGPVTAIQFAAILKELEAEWALEGNAAKAG